MTDKPQDKISTRRAVEQAIDRSKKPGLWWKLVKPGGKPGYG